MATTRPFPTLERPPIGRTRSTTSAFRVHASSLSRSRSATTSHTRVTSSAPSPLNKVHSLSSMLFHRLKDTASSPTTKRSLAGLPSLNIPGNIYREFSPSPTESSPLRSAYTWKSESCGTPLPYWAYYYDDWRSDSEDGEDVDLVVNNAVGFREKHHFNTLHGMKVHPYGNETPYMQTYEPMILESDRYTDDLLQRINPTGTPAFKFSSRAPTLVLDLGCGQGRWVLEAATYWREFGTKVVGFDLVDISTEYVERKRNVPENVQFVRGNFIRYELPFPDNTFEFVRMANLSLCIPFDRWDFVLCQVRRVLKLGGRLEIIDDQMMFPYGKQPVPPSPPMTPLPASPATTSSITSLPLTREDDRLLDEGVDLTPPDDDESASDLSTIYPVPDPYALWDSKATSSKALETAFERMLVESGIHPRPSDFLEDILRHVFGRSGSKLASFHLFLPPTESEGDKESDRDSMGSFDSGFHSGSSGTPKRRRPWLTTIEWDTKKKDGGDDDEKAKALEGGPDCGDPSISPVSTKSSWFTREKKDSDAGSIFGLFTVEWDKKDGKDEKDKKDEKDLASVESCNSEPVSASPTTTKKPWYAIEWDKEGTNAKVGEEKPKERKKLRKPRPGTPPTLKRSSSKDSFTSKSPVSHAQVAPTKAPVPSLPRGQPEGLIIYPDTFIPFTPLELEMHACKNMHTLLGCKPALADYLAKYKDENGEPVVGDDEFKDTMWEYESFRRDRFHWSSEIPELRMEKLVKRPLLFSSDSPIFGSSKKKNSFSSDWNFEELPHVRTIRVYEAFKYRSRPIERPVPF